MDMNSATLALAALAHATRLAVFRSLVQAGPAGLSAGELATALDVPPPTLSFHLKDLMRAGLLKQRREQRFIHYSADFTAMRNLLIYLTDDCCQGRPEICAGLLGAIPICDNLQGPSR